MIKIAYITASLEGSGGPLPIPAVTRVLRNAGVHVEVFALTRRDGRALPAMLADDLQVHIREGGDFDHITAYRWLDKQMAAFKPTLIWTSVARASIIGILLGRKYGVPVVCWQHNANLKFSRKLLFYLLRKRPAMWVGDSEMVTEITAKRFRVPPEKMASWPLFSVNTNAPQAQPWQQGQTLRLGSLGRLHPQKAYDVLIEALALLKQRGFVAPVPFEVVIAGDGKEHDNIISLAQRAGVAEQIRLIGFADKPQDFLASLHVYLQPSRVEGFCIAVHEAMQAGLPVIATAVGQIPYTVEAGHSGWLVPPRDANALADALADALANPAQLAAMGQAARNRVLPLYSAEAFRQAGEDILNRLKAQGVLS
ncbi:MAG: glycosyltransferase family 4 protein [Methylotenera sp.]|nr:glycosyltransferase family 4 protein [Methylotenera sp.]NOT64882.1 glycosyltransferase family 4 protein [Methylotenera sp.]